MLYVDNYPSTYDAVFQRTPHAIKFAKNSAFHYVRRGGTRTRRRAQRRPTCRSRRVRRRVPVPAAQRWAVHHGTDPAPCTQATRACCWRDQRMSARPARPRRSRSEVGLIRSPSRLHHEESRVIRVCVSMGRDLPKASRPRDTRDTRNATATRDGERPIAADCHGGGPTHSASRLADCDAFLANRLSSLRTSDSWWRPGLAFTQSSRGCDFRPSPQGLDPRARELLVRHHEPGAAPCTPNGSALNCWSTNVSDHRGHAVCAPLCA
jgi:hypothetical protein